MAYNARPAPRAATALPSGPDAKEGYERKSRGNPDAAVYKGSVVVPRVVRNRVAELALHEGRSQNDLWLEGMDLLFRSRGLPSIDELTK